MESKYRTLSQGRFILTSKVVLNTIIISVLSIAAILWYLNEIRYIIYAGYVVMPLLLIVPLILAHRETEDRTTNLSFNQASIQFIILFILSFALAILLLRITEYRTVGFYVLATTAGTAILLQIIYLTDTRFNRIVILAQITSLILLLIYSISLNYWYFVGGTDTLAHVSRIDELLATGNVQSPSIYKKFPLWHILVSVIIMISDSPVPTNRAIMVISGLVFAILPVLTYAVSRYVISSERTRLLTTFFICINISVIYYGAYSISRSIVGVLLLGLFYGIFSTRMKRAIPIFALFATAIVVYHPASPPFIFPLLLGILGTKLVYSSGSISRGRDRIVLFTALFAIIVMIYWLFYATEMIRAIPASLFIDPGSASVDRFAFPTPTISEHLEQLYRYLPYSVLFGLILYAIGIPLRERSISPVQKSAVLLGLGGAAVSFPSPLLIIETFQSINFDRWGLYTPFFVSIASATGFVALYRRLRSPARYLLMISLVLLLFTSFTNPTLAADNPTFGQETHTPYLERSEQMAIEFSIEYTSERVMSDYVVTRYLYFNSDISHILIINPETRKPIPGDRDNLILLRNEELKQRGLKLYPSERYLYRPWVGRVMRTRTVHVPDQYNKIYAGDGTTGYIAQ